jgi:hypothetical protein
MDGGCGSRLGGATIRRAGLKCLRFPAAPIANVGTHTHFSQQASGRATLCAM